MLGILFTFTTMFFYLQFHTNKELVDSLKARGTLTDENAIQAMLETDRALYCKNNSYQDSPQPIGYGVTISAPHMHAAALQHLSSRLKPGCRALDVGHGTGYVAACMARMVGILQGKGKVVGIEIVKPLVPLSIENVRADCPRMLESPNFELLHGDGWKGAVGKGPFDAIHVGAAADELPDQLVEQLEPNGLLFIPIGPAGGEQHIFLVEKKPDGRIQSQKLFGVSYVPLVKDVRRHTGPDDSD